MGKDAWQYIGIDFYRSRDDPNNTPIWYTLLPSHCLYDSYLQTEKQTILQVQEEELSIRLLFEIGLTIK